LALARGEALLLRRNPTALATAVAAPAVMFSAQMSNVGGSGVDGVAGLGTGALLVASLAAFSLIFSIYYNLVVALVARREGMVLKRLRSGEISDTEILAGTAAPGVAIAWTQIVIGLLAGLIFLDMSGPINPLPAVAGVVMGSVVLVLLAAVSTALTRSVEMAQLTAVPLMLVSMIFSGLMFPLDGLPAPVSQVARMLPVTQVVDLLRLGLAGITPGGESVGLAGTLMPALVPVLLLGGWVVFGVWATRRWFRWEPRR
jgi:ABC-2 type transport system permease protein